VIFEAVSEETEALNILKLLAIEAIVETSEAVDINPMVPKPTKELVSWGVEIILESDREDK
jgi:hypothetical protein